MCAFYLAFCTSKKQAVRPDGTGHPLPPEGGTPLKKVRCCTAAHLPPPSGMKMEKEGAFAPSFLLIRFYSMMISERWVLAETPSAWGVI
ncbi:hypothetical protein C814_03310 [Anaerotruncus sp. G3(2012)]|nr:hypothetical protein C814_03310 [Anaerotruncus sp. G3(2012)]